MYDSYIEIAEKTKHPLLSLSASSVEKTLLSSNRVTDKSHLPFQWSLRISIQCLPRFLLRFCSTTLFLKGMPSSSHRKEKFRRLLPVQRNRNQLCCVKYLLWKCFSSLLDFRFSHKEVAWGIPDLQTHKLDKWQTYERHWIPSCDLKPLSSNLISLT